jgi:hypothetical protein
MAFGLRLWDAAGNLTFDSDVPIVGCYMGIFNGVIGSTSTISFPSIPGRSVSVRLNIGWPTGVSPVVDLSAGYPVVTLPAANSGNVFYPAGGATWVVYAI